MTSEICEISAVFGLSDLWAEELKHTHKERNTYVL